MLCLMTIQLNTIYWFSQPLFVLSWPGSNDNILSSGILVETIIETSPTLNIITRTSIIVID